jgi:ribosomal protein S18 acetylase RimI-like enzyme
VSARFVIEPLGAHDRAAFCSGVAALDKYLGERASQDAKRLIASCFVAVDGDTRRIAGYCTLAATSIPIIDIASETLKRLPRYPTLPAALVGRLAVDRQYHRKGLGSAMLADAALRVIKSEVKAFALVVDAKDEGALAFYRAFGFVQFFSRPLSLYLPIETMRKAKQLSDRV